MNKEEEKILHGLYYNREIVGEEMIYPADGIKWLGHAHIFKRRGSGNADGEI